MSTWVKIQTDSGPVYYHNPDTDVTAWDLPPGAVLSTEPVVTSVQEGVKRGFKRASMLPPSLDLLRAASGSLLDTRHTTTDGAAAAAAAAAAVRAKSSTMQAGTKRSTVRPHLNPKKQRVGTYGKKKNGGRGHTMTNTLNKVNKGPIRPLSQATNRKHPKPLPNIINSNRTQSQESLDSQVHDSQRRHKERLQQKNESEHCCHRFRTMPLSVWSMLLVPLIFSLISGWYFYDVDRRYGSNKRIATPDNDSVEMVTIGTDNYSKEVYLAHNLSWSKNDSCKKSFVEQTSENNARLCEAYANSCALGGDTPSYTSNLPWALAGFWFVIFIAVGVLFPKMKTFFQGNTGSSMNGKIVWSELRAFLLLCLVLYMFCTLLFLIHESRIIAVPQGHSMFTFWVFYSSFFLTTSTVYWMRMDVQLIKARNPELALGGALCGYAIITNAVGAHYLTGSQTWPCIVSMFTFYVLYPAYFLSFTRRGLELWVLARHHKKILKKMKAEEFDALDDDSEEEDDEDDSEDEEENDKGTIGSRNRTSSGKRLKKFHREDTYDPEMAAIRDTKRMKEKQKKNKKKKRRRKKKKSMHASKIKKKSWCGCCSGGGKSYDGRDIEMGDYNLSGKRFDTSNPAMGLQSHPSNSNMHQGGHAIPAGKSAGEGGGGGGGESKGGQVVRRRRLSAVDLQIDMKEHKKGTLGGRNKRFTSKANIVRYLYWFLITLGFSAFLVRYFLVRKPGEVGCIARQGNLTYFLMGCLVIVFQLITLFLLRKVKDEFAIRRELCYVTVASLLFMMPHISLLFYVYQEDNGCSQEFVTLRAGAAFRNQPCAISLYAYWLLLFLIAVVHVATIAFPVGLSLAQGALKLREQSIITAANYKGPKLLASFESAVSDSLCAKYFRRFLAHEFTLDNMRILVDIENFKTSIDPSYIGVLRSFGHIVRSPAAVASDSAPASFARACHTISAWSTFSGNLPITLLSDVGRKMVKRDTDVPAMTQQARDIVKRYFSNEFWCNLYDSKMIKDMFLSIYNSLLDLTHQQESPPRSASLTPEAHLHKLFRMLFVVFDDVLEMVYKSLTETSYPKFVQSDIGLDLRARLSMGAEARQQFGSKGIDM